MLESSSLPAAPKGQFLKNKECSLEYGANSTDSSDILNNGK